MNMEPTKRSSPSAKTPLTVQASAVSDRKSGIYDFRSITTHGTASGWKRQVVLQVTIADAVVQNEVEGCLREKGYGVLRHGGLPQDAEFGTVTVAIKITPRQREVLEALAVYDGSKEIAAALGVTTKVVDDHIQRLMEKLDVHSRHRLLVKALALRLLNE
jgi:DNA-binding CsgD family transcriptional regulator